MVACLVARNVYKEELLAQCLRPLVYKILADNFPGLSRQILKLRWKLRLATGFDPQGVTLPKRSSEISNWKGPMDEGVLRDLKKAYANRILELAKGQRIAEKDLDLPSGGSPFALTDPFWQLQLTQDACVPGNPFSPSR